jgi:hypothetical protein
LPATRREPEHPHAARLGQWRAGAVQRYGGLRLRHPGSALSARASSNRDRVAAIPARSVSARTSSSVMPQISRRRGRRGGRACPCHSSFPPLISASPLGTAPSDVPRDACGRPRDPSYPCQQFLKALAAQPSNRPSTSSWSSQSSSMHARACSSARHGRGGQRRASGENPGHAPRQRPIPHSPQRTPTPIRRHPPPGPSS